MPGSNHILVIPKPEAPGKTYIIGDVHGEIGGLQAVLAKLQPQDILIIAGDLFDRGAIVDPETGDLNPTSKQVMDVMIANAQAPAGTVPKIYSIRGNHEQDLLEILAMFEECKHRKTFDRQKLMSMANKIVTFISNGGAWIFNRTDNTPAQNQRFHAFKNFGYNQARSEKDIIALFPYIRALIAMDDLSTELLPEIKAYQEYVASIPFMVKVEEDRPVLVVHADLPLSDEEVDCLIAANEGFTDAQIQHLTGARVHEFAQGVRDHRSNMVVVGHNIIDEPENTSSTSAVPVRASTNHINLDGGAYFTKGFLCYNVTDNQIEIVGSNLPKESLPLLNYARDKIADHLRTVAHQDTRDFDRDANSVKRMRKGSLEGN